MQRLLWALAVALAGGLLTVMPLPSQDPNALQALQARDAKVLANTVAAMQQLATAFADQRQHGRAHELWKEILLEYDDNDAKAREACGYTKVGELWQPDPNKLVLEKDLTGDKKALKKVDADYTKFRKLQLAEHRALAEAWEAVGDKVHASRHWRRVLALDPDDAKAAGSLAVSRFAGFRGTDDELAMLRRGLAIRGAVDWLLRQPFEVKPIEGRRHPLLEKAGIGHAGFRSAHYEAWGTLPQGQLVQTLQHCERALALCGTLFGNAGGAPFVSARHRDFLLVGDDTAYGKVLDQCADQFDAARMAFLKKDVDMAFLKVGAEEVRCIKTNGSEEEAFDQAVRGVVQDAVGLHTDGLWEGLGHAACGLLFGRTITFMLEQQTGQTVASWAQKLLVPDIKAWMAIAKQSAWGKSDTRTSELVLLSAARFTTEQRVKSWAICDYFFRWRPELLWELDRSRTEDIKTPPDVEAEFTRRTGLALPAIDAAYRDYWARHDELRAAMVADPLGDPKAKDHELRLAARAVVDAVDALRTASGRGPVGFYFAEDADVQAALQYADRLVKAEKDQAKRPKELVPMPQMPAALGRTVLLARTQDPEAAVLGWWSRPAARDALVHSGRGLLGANRNQNCTVLDIGEPVQATTRGLPLPWPMDGQKDVPGSAQVRDLGPCVGTALEAAGHPPGLAPEGRVAMPWTLHFHRPVNDVDKAAIQCEVFYDGVRAPGVLVVCQEDAYGDCAPGCFAYVCFSPPQSGARVEVDWTMPKALLAKDEVYRPISFTVK